MRTRSSIGVLLPTSGRVVIDGHDVVNDAHEVRQRIGYLPDVPPLYEEMTAVGIGLAEREDVQ